MTRAARTTYLGGIGLMLEVAHICPRCGKRVSDSPRSATDHLTKEGCVPTVFAALPERDVDEVPPVPATRQIFDFEVPAPAAHRGGALEAATAVGPAPLVQGGSRGIAIPWLHPPDLGEVL